jgi:hypothetical protein
MGLEADKVDEIIEAHVSTTDALKEERDRYKKEAEANKDAKAELDRVSKELETLKADGGKEDTYKVKYEALKEEFDDFKNGIEAEKTKTSKTKAYKELLKEIGISEKRIDAVTRIADLDKIELDKDGNIKKADDLKNSLKEEWSDFIESTHTEGADVSNPPKKTGGTSMTKDEIMNIKDAGERQAAIAENHQLFGF